MYQVERQYPNQNAIDVLDNKKTYHILVLGGGHTRDKNLHSINQLGVDVLGRLVEGIRNTR